MKFTRLLFTLIGFAAFLWSGAIQIVSAQSPGPEAVVRAVMFYSPTCGHCHHVINEVLPPLFEKYGSRLSIIGIDVTQPEGDRLFMEALQKFRLDSAGVPFLVIGDKYLMGSVDIPEQLPGLVELYLSQGGIDFPEIPGLREILSEVQTTEPTTSVPPTQEGVSPDTVTPTQTKPAEIQNSPTPALTVDIPNSPPPTPSLVIDTPAPPPSATSFETLPVTTTGEAPSTGLSMTSIDPTPGLNLRLGSEQKESMRTKFSRDPIGNSLAVIVLVLMLASLLWIALYFRQAPSKETPNDWGWVIPILSLIGMAVAGYLAYIETQQVTAVCGPVGDCNTVQQSEYARLMGVIPVGVIGVLGYGVILICWFIRQFSNRKLANLASITLLGVTAFGTLFSIYLTFLEPFVIGATCAWCLTSALIMTILMLLSLAPARIAVNQMRNGDKRAQTLN